MPVHDWSRVGAGILHAFHTAWIGRLQDALNETILPGEYYALAEQRSGDIQPDVLTLQHGHEQPNAAFQPGADGTIAVTDAPPHVWRTTTLDLDPYTVRRRSLVVRSASDDRLVAIIEIMSPGNKSSQHAFEQFLDKALACFDHELHQLIVDLHKPTSRAPQGIHGAVTAMLNDLTYQSPSDQKLTLVSYEGGIPPKTYIQPIATGDALPAMPLPLEATYQAAFQGLPRIYKQQLEAS